MSNPLLAEHMLPEFSKIHPQYVYPAITTLLDESRKSVHDLLSAEHEFSWANLIDPLENLHDRLSKAWSPVSHMNAVLNSDELRDAYNKCLPLLSDYWTDLGQNQLLYEAYLSISKSPNFESLDIAQKKIVSNALRDFRLSGIALDVEKKTRFKEIEQSLSKLTSEFSDNLLDATNAWVKRIDQEDNLRGLPDGTKVLARQRAQDDGDDGWTLTLEMPCYIAVMTYADNQDLRKEMYEAHCTRASDQGPFAGKWDNSAIMEQILELRHEKARLLGFDNYGELSLATKMADTTTEVLKFLDDLASRSRTVAENDLADLQCFVKEQFGITALNAWDIAYYSEKLRQHRFDFSQEEVKDYFPVDRVLSGLFSIVEKLYGIHIHEKSDIDTWHPDVRFFEIVDAEQTVRGSFYLDLFARPKKRGGAWMDECVNRKRTVSGTQNPVAYLVCNFESPVGDQPALLRHEEVVTLFHEFGHGLHHMLSKVEFLGASGIHGVEWDAVELPSQFMENWCWEKDALALISIHYQSGQKLPDDLFSKMIAAKNFQSGMQMVRQLEFSIFDFRIHLEYPYQPGHGVYDILDEVRDRVAVLIPPEFNRFAHGFAHIFAGGYAAGYYSYKWAEVLSSDAFSLFEENGIFDSITGQSFLHNILEKGGSQDAMDLFTEFRGREPSIDALLRHNGIAA